MIMITYKNNEQKVAAFHRIPGSAAAAAAATASNGKLPNISLI